MAWYPYSYKTAFDPTTGDRAPAGSAGEIYAIGDTGFTTPLQPYDLAGLPVDLTVQGDVGYIPTFQVEDQTSVIWKSGDYIFEFTTTKPLPGPTGAAVNAVTDNGDGTITFTRTDGETIGPIELPVGAGGSDAGVAGYVDSTTSETHAALNKHYATIRVGLTPETKGAVGDGVTDDTTALNDAIASAVTFGAPVLLTGSYAATELAIADAVKFTGPGGFVKTGTAVSNWLTLSNSVEFSGVTFDGAGLVNVLGVSIIAGTPGITFRDCSFTRLPITIRARETANLTITGNTFDDVAQAVFMSGLVSGKVKYNKVTNWVDRGIYVDGSTVGSENLEISHNRVTTHAGGGNPRHPIQIVGTATDQHRWIKVNHNHVVGPGKSWTATDPGTADQISLHHCVDFECIGNYSEGGGDMGITISQECSRGVVHDNICTLNDVSGLTLGSGASSFVRNISVKGNVCFNNGQNRNADRNADGRVGIRIEGGDTCTAMGNITGDTQATKTQQYGVSVISSTDIIARDNTDDGNALGPINWDTSTWGGDTVFANASGKSSLSMTASTIHTLDIVYPAGKFTVPPILQVYVVGQSLTDPVVTTYANNTVTGATITARSPVNRNVAVQWYAFQGTPGAAEE